MVDTMLDTIRQQGLRVTPVVKTLVNYLYSSRTVNSAIELKAVLIHKLGYTIPDSTIYRSCERLVACGIFHTTFFNNGITGYFICREMSNREHQHFICRYCHCVQEIHVSLKDCFGTSVESCIDGRLEQSRILFEGVCSSCEK